MEDAKSTKMEVGPGQSHECGRLRDCFMPRDQVPSYPRYSPLIHPTISSSFTKSLQLKLEITGNLQGNIDICKNITRMLQVNETYQGWTGKVFFTGPKIYGPGHILCILAD